RGPASHARGSCTGASLRRARRGLNRCGRGAVFGPPLRFSGALVSFLANQRPRAAECGPPEVDCLGPAQPHGRSPNRKGSCMADVPITDLLEAGVHFGHQTRRWNPKMRRFIFGERDGIHIIDLQQTERLLKNAQEFAASVAGRGGTIMFVGTKKQARDAIKEAADEAGMPYVNQRWLGGLLTTFQTIS